MAGHAVPPEDPTIQEDPRSAEWRARHMANKHTPRQSPKNYEISTSPELLQKVLRRKRAPKFSLLKKAPRHCGTTYRLNPWKPPCTGDAGCRCECAMCRGVRLAEGLAASSSRR